jgi:predicted membrane-bound spermidine synthase
MPVEQTDEVTGVTSNAVTINHRVHASTPSWIVLIIFIEGFCSLGAEIVALRRLVPHVGSAIVVTAPTIGFFLLALALGYAAGGKVTEGHLARVTRNFLLSGLIVGVGLAGPVVNALFSHLQPAWLAQGLDTDIDLLDAIREGAVLRVRPKAMTVAVIVAGLLPLFWGAGAGSEVMQRIAAPMVGGMLSAPLLSMLVVPVIYRLMRKPKR